MWLQLKRLILKSNALCFTHNDFIVVAIIGAIATSTVVCGPHLAMLELLKEQNK
jgi:hypothetical protein